MTILFCETCRTSFHTRELPSGAIEEFCLTCLLRAALAGLVGASDHAELEQVEMAIRMMPIPLEDRARTIDAIHALMAATRAD